MIQIQPIKKLTSNIPQCKSRNLFLKEKNVQANNQL